ncbi:hypothetical protein BJV78DRAFT_241313 [Lactifluus subvellereus]|nr:hypothetical protein BJV78DRAFT_241313 [Lactifluus subvellereus]
MGPNVSADDSISSYSRTTLTMRLFPWPKAKTNAQRVFADLIKESSGKWPNWDPAEPIWIGEFGTVGKKTGEWKPEGNIFSHPDIAPIATKYLWNTETRNTSVPQDELQVSRIRVATTILIGVADTAFNYNCPGFFMYLSDKASKQITISLRANVIPQAAGTNSRPYVMFSWRAEGSTGISHRAYRPYASYSPLFGLRDVRRPLLRI